LEVKAITHRKQPIYHALHPQSKDAYSLISPSWGLEVLSFLNQLIPGVKAVRLSPGNLCDTAIIQLEKRDDTEPRRALLLALTTFLTIKKAVAVDDDVDILDLEDVDWAISTRAQGDKDMLILTQLAGTDLDPSAGEGNITSKIGIDATKPWQQRQRFDRVHLPSQAKTKAKAILRDLL
jgi:2,5-furandicarboxylate decarboxylase 1